LGIEFETIKEEMIPIKHYRGESFIDKQERRAEDFGQSEKRFNSVKSPFLRDQYLKYKQA